MNATMSAGGPSIQASIRESALSLEFRIPAVSKIRRGCCVRYEPPPAVSTGLLPGAGRNLHDPDAVDAAQRHLLHRNGLQTQPGAYPLFGRRWLCDVYPQDAAEPWFARIYLFLRARDKHETEDEFIAWVRSEGVRFRIVVTEPAPSGLYISASSEDCWWGLCEGFGTWCLSLPLCAQLANLRQDTLVLRVEFGGGEEAALDALIAAAGLQQCTVSTPAAVENNHAQMRRHILQQEAHRLVAQHRFVAFGPPPSLAAAQVATTIDTLIDNPLTDDCEFLGYNRIGSQPNPSASTRHKSAAARETSCWRITAQSSVLSSRLSEWTSITADAQQTSVISIPVYGISRDSMRYFLSYVYTGIMSLPRTAEGFAEMLLLAERFGHDDLALACSREIYSLLSDTDETLSLADKYGGLSEKLLIITSSYLALNFKSTRQSSLFYDMIASPSRSRVGLWLAMFRCSVSAANPATCTDNHTSTSNNESNALDQLDEKNDIIGSASSQAAAVSGSHPAVDGTLSMALSTLFDNPAVSDVRFLVEGKSVYSQRCFLESVSSCFKDMLVKAQTSKASNGKEDYAIQVEGTSYSIFRNMIRFLYAGSFDPVLTLSEIAEMQRLALVYQIPSLIEHTSMLLRSAFMPDSVTSFLFSSAYQHERLKQISLSYIWTHASEVFETDDFAITVLNPSLNTAGQYPILIRDLFNGMNESSCFNASAFAATFQSIRDLCVFDGGNSQPSLDKISATGIKSENNLTSSETRSGRRNNRMQNQIIVDSDSAAVPAPKIARELHNAVDSINNGVSAMNTDCGDAGDPAASSKRAHRRQIRLS